VITKYSKIGEYHSRHSMENQDAVSYRMKGNYSVISLADGVSTCSRSGRGAEIASRAASNLLARDARKLACEDKYQFSKCILTCILRQLAEESKKSGAAVEDYSSTIASVLIDKKRKKIYCFNVGDGIVFGITKESCRILSVPGDTRNGCCVTTTKGAERMATVRIDDTGSVESIVICSDGAWREMFDRDRLKPEVKTILINKDYDELGRFLDKQHCFDDHSFITADIKGLCGGTAL